MNAAAANQDVTTISLDVHAHLAPIDSTFLATIEGVDWHDDAQQLTVDGRNVGVKGLFHPHQLIAWMDTQNVAQAWVSIPPPLYRQHLTIDAAQDWCAYVNNGLATICSGYPGRLAPLFYLPLEHPELACKVVQSYSAEITSQFSVAAGGHRQIVFSSPALEPLWHLLNRRPSFVFVHPGHCCDERLSSFYLENLLGNPYETAVAASHLVLGGVLERHPKIRFCLAHGGGATAQLAGRLQQGFTTRRPGIDATLQPPDTLLKRLMADCITHDACALEMAATVFGDKHILFGSDWPFPMGLQQPHTQLAKLKPLLLKQIFMENAVNTGVM